MKKVTKVKADIRKFKNALIKKWKTKEAYENFGQKEVRKLENKYIDISSYTDEMNQIRKTISAFDNWAMDYTG